MKIEKRLTLLALIGLPMVFFSSCNWTGGSDSDFNTSRGSLNINISGVYSGALSGSRAVSQTSGGAITSFVVQQSGNVVEVRDSNGQSYRGTVGSPLALTSVSQGGTLPVGAQLANFQVNWSGNDGVAAKNINFTGVINLVSVTDINGTRKVDANTKTNTDTSGKSSSSTSGSGVDSSVDNGKDNTQTVNQGVPQVVPTDPNGGTAVEGNTTENITTLVSNVITTNGVTKASATSSSNLNSNVNTVTTTTTNEYTLDNSNTQFRLRGTWIEDGGVVGQVDAVAPGAGGVLVVLSTGDTGAGGSSTLDTITNGNTGGN